MFFLEDSELEFALSVLNQEFLSIPFESLLVTRSQAVTQVSTSYAYVDGISVRTIKLPGRISQVLLKEVIVELQKDHLCRLQNRKTNQRIREKKK